MAFKMGFDKDKMSGQALMPAGIYEVMLDGFKPRPTKDKSSVTFNAQMKIINHPEFDGSRLYETLPAAAGFIQYDFVHAFGMDMEDQGNGQLTMPGVWDGDIQAFKEDDPTTWKYDGPLVGRTAKVEVAIDTYLGKENNKVKRYFCAMPDGYDAAHWPENQHREDLLRKR